MSFVTDITARRKAEKELLASRHFNQRLLDGTPNLIYVYDLIEKRNIYANREVSDFLGYTAELVQAMGSSLFTQILHPEDAHDVAIHHTRCAAAADQDVLEVIYRVKHPSGEWRWFRSKDVAFRRDANGHVTQILGTTEDITDRKLAEEKIKRSSLEWRTTFDSISDMISIQDRDFKVVRINKAYADALGMPVKEVIGKTCYDIMHCANAPIAGCPHEQTLKSGKQAVLEIEDKAKGTYSEIYTYPIFDEIGNITSTVHIVHDVTARKKAELEARQLRDKAEMSSRLASIGEMAAGIAHEINNPLTGVIGFSELLLERKDLPEDTREELKIIYDGSQRVKEIIRRMLTFARQTKPQKNDINLNEVMENTLELRSYVLRTANIEIIKDFDPELPEVFGDPGQMQQVFLNLIVNAEYAMKKAPGRGKLTIKTERLKDCVRIFVQDDGPGLSPEAKIKLFQPFFTTKAPGEGTGLGLALSLGIVKEHSGSLRAESQPGQGATFVIELPITTGDKQVDVKETSPEIKVPAKKATVLVIDDEPSVRSLVHVMLAQNGHTVDESDSFDKALDQLAGRAYDLIFLDVRMPGMSGTELYTEMTKRWPALVGQIIFITGDTSDQATREYLTQHKVPYLSKPFDHKKLEDMVALVLQKRK